MFSLSVRCQPRARLIVGGLLAEMLGCIWAVAMIPFAAWLWALGAVPYVAGMVLVRRGKKMPASEEEKAELRRLASGHRYLPAGRALSARVREKYHKPETGQPLSTMELMDQNQRRFVDWL